MSAWRQTKQESVKFNSFLWDCHIYSFLQTNNYSLSHFFSLNFFGLSQYLPFFLTSNFSFFRVTKWLLTQWLQAASNSSSKTSFSAQVCCQQLVKRATTKDGNHFSCYHWHHVKKQNKKSSKNKTKNHRLSKKPNNPKTPNKQKNPATHTHKLTIYLKLYVTISSLHK